MNKGLVAAPSGAELDERPWAFQHIDRVVAWRVAKLYEVLGLVGPLAPLEAELKSEI